ncbi:VOC family protein [Streptomyces sp. NPDC059819]|uniref:VOC family protein n=1 Tax=Streptomyces sp. NPDC059819 TaxID=3346963 RepID=UPI00364D17F6
MEVTLMVPGAPAMDPKSAEAMKTLIAKAILGAGVLASDDVHGDYEALTVRGVESLQEPQGRPYGTGAIFRDDSGNWFSVTQARRGDLDTSKEWGLWFSRRRARCRGERLRTGSTPRAGRVPTPRPGRRIGDDRRGERPFPTCNPARAGQHTAQAEVLHTGSSATRKIF